MKFSFTDPIYNQRIVQRLHVTESNKKISGIANKFISPNKVFSYIMDCFYAGTEPLNIEKYQAKISPIDYFALTTLKGYSKYLSNIIEEWNLIDPSDRKNYNVNNLYYIINRKATEIRQLLLKNGALPEYNDQAKPLPVITDRVIKKADEALKASQTQVSEKTQRLIDERKKKYEENLAEARRKRAKEKAEKNKAKEQANNTSDKTSNNKKDKPQTPKTEEQLKKEAIYSELVKQEQSLRELENHKNNLNSVIKQCKDDIFTMKYENKITDESKAHVYVQEKLNESRKNIKYLESLLQNINVKTEATLQKIGTLKDLLNEKSL